MSQKTRETAWKVLWMRVFKGLIGLAIVIAVVFWLEPYPCQACKKTGFEPGSNEKVECGKCGGDGRITIAQRHLGY